MTKNIIVGSIIAQRYEYSVNSCDLFPSADINASICRKNYPSENAKFAQIALQPGEKVLL